MREIIGQDAAVGVLRQALESGRVHHAWIFHGPAGVGKFTTALAFAAELLGDTAGRGENHPDLHVITKELAAISDDAALRRKKQMNIPVDLLRERVVGGFVNEKYIAPPVGQKSVCGGAKVFIIDEAELLDGAGQNSLLKTLEEPPAGTFLLLVTAQEERLLPTIRSRCQRVAFTSLEDEAVAAWLDDDLNRSAAEAQQRVDDLRSQKKLGKREQDEAEAMERRLAERLKMPKAERALVVRFAQGSLGRAKLAVDYGLDKWVAQIEPMAERTAGGVPQADLGPRMAELVDAFAVAWVDDHPGASKDAANKAGVRHMLSVIGSLCRRKMHEIAEQASGRSPDEVDVALAPWLAGVALIGEAERNLASNVAIALLLDHLAIRWPHYGAPGAAQAS